MSSAASCPLCQEQIDEQAYEAHVERCLSGLIAEAETELAVHAERLYTSSTTTVGQPEKTIGQSEKTIGQSEKTIGQSEEATTIEATAEERRSEPANEQLAATIVGGEQLEEPAVVWVHGRRAMVQSLLAAAGFHSYGQVWVHSGHDVTVELTKQAERQVWKASLLVDGLVPSDVADWCRLSAGERLAGEQLGDWLAGLLAWVHSQRQQETPGFVVDDERGDEAAEDWGPSFQYLPSAGELGVSRARSLRVFTWGRALMKTAPGESQHTFNAAVLNGRGGGVDLKKYNGLSEGVQHNVARCSLFPDWLRLVCTAIESKNYTCVSIVCTKGRHRSVAAAEILRRFYYPDATVHHLTIR